VLGLPNSGRSRGMLRVGKGERRATGCSALPKAVGSEKSRLADLLPQPLRLL